MIRNIIFLFCIFSIASVSADTVYKKTNPDGSVTFTDQQSSDSEEVNVREPTSFAPLSVPGLNLPTKKLKANFGYVITIFKPEEDSTVTGQQDVVVAIGLTPNLNVTHKIRFQLGSQTIDSKSTQVTFINVDRGTHTISVSIIDKNGNTVSPVVTSVFHMKRFFKKPTTPAPKPKAP